MGAPPTRRPYRFRGWDWTELASCWGYRRPRGKTHRCRECDQDVPLRDPSAYCARCGIDGDGRAEVDFILGRLDAAMAAIERGEDPGPTVTDLRRFLGALADAEHEHGWAPIWRAMSVMPDAWHLCQAAAVLLRAMWT